MSIEDPRKVDTQGAPYSERTFYFAAAVPQYSAVALDRSTTTYGLGAAAKQHPSGTDDNPEIVGVNRKAIAAGTWAKIVTYGVVYCRGNADIEAGKPVCADTAAAGQVREAVEGTDGNIIGSALGDEASVTLDDGTSVTCALLFVKLGG